MMVYIRRIIPIFFGRTFRVICRVVNYEKETPRMVQPEFTVATHAANFKVSISQLLDVSINRPVFIHLFGDQFFYGIHGW